MKSFIYLVCIGTALLSFSCSENSDKKKKEHKEGSLEYTIEGTIANLPGKIVYLEEIRDRSWVIIDSVETSSKVAFKGDLDDVDFFRIRLVDNKFLPVFLDGKPVTFTADAKDLFATVQYKNSRENQIYADFNREDLEMNKKHSELSAKLDALQSKPRSDSATEYMKQIKNLEAERDAYIKKTIEDNVSSPIVFSMLSYTDWENDFPFIESVTTKIKQNLPDYKYTASLVTNVNQYKAYTAQQAEKEKNSPAAIGMEAPEFAIPDVNGKMVRLSSYRGKYLLLDFWASWCGPCRQESPNVVKVYNKYKGKDFDVLSVSLDDSKDKWLQAIEKDGFTWRQLSELKSWQSTVVSLYKLESIPATFLIDPKGVIIAKNLHGKALDQKLTKLFNK